MNLYHYYDRTIGPFKSLTEISLDEAKAVLDDLKRTRPESQPASRNDKYVQYRRNCEAILRKKCAEKGIILNRESPYYMVIEHSPWLSTWYENSTFVKIPIEEFDLRTLSFTYGDSMPTFSDSFSDGKEYRKQLYTYEEILDIIKKYGLPQLWNDDGSRGPERYIEVHIWDDTVIKNYI